MGRIGASLTSTELFLLVQLRQIHAASGPAAPDATPLSPAHVDQTVAAMGVIDRQRCRIAELVQQIEAS